MNPYYHPSFDKRFPSWGSEDIKGYGDSSEGDPYTQDSQGGGENFGRALGVTTAGIGLGLNAYGMSQQGLGLNYNIADSQYDPSMKPSYTAGQLQNDAFSAKPQGATGGDIINGALQGAGAGAEFGPLGAGVGAAFGIATNVIGGYARKRRQRREKDRALGRVKNAQDSFNTQSRNFQTQQNQMEDYQQRNDPNARMYNVYRSQI